MTEHPAIAILGYSEAAMLLRNPGDARIEAIIAIHGRREYPVATDGVRQSIVLQFDDTEAPNAGDLLQEARIRIRQREAVEIGLTLTPPTPDDAGRIIEFARSIRDMRGALLCQCQAGVSRSPAAALLCLAAWTAPGLEEHCVHFVLSIRPCAQPHRDLVRFGDEHLGRNGRLIAALERAGR